MSVGGSNSDHAWHDQRSLKFHRIIAARLNDEPGRLEAASALLRRWMRIRKPIHADYEWLKILSDDSVQEIVSLITSESEKAKELRQSSPMMGVLTRQEIDSFRDSYRLRAPHPSSRIHR